MGSSNGNGKRGLDVVSSFTLAQLEQLADKEGFELILKDPETPAYCGYVGCGKNFHHQHRIQIVEDTRSGRRCLWCAGEHMWPQIKVVSVRRDFLVAAVAEIVGLKIVSLEEPTDEPPVQQDRSRTNGRKRHTNRQKRHTPRRRSGHRPAYTPFRQ